MGNDLTFGTTEASALIVNLQTTQSIEEVSSAEFVLKIDMSPIVMCRLSSYSQRRRRRRILGRGLQTARRHRS